MKNARADFNSMVATAKRDFPWQTASTTFIDSSADDAFDRLKKYTRSSSKAAEMFIHRNIFCRDFFGFEPLLMTDTRNASTFFKNDKSKDAHFTFFHELGHHVVPRGFSLTSFFSTRLDKTIMNECTADMFSSIYGLRHGWMTKEDIVFISKERAACAHSGDVTHMTTHALNWLVEQADKHDWQAMSPRQIKYFVNRNAVHFKPSRTDKKELEDYASSLKCGGVEEFFDTIENAFEKSRPGSPLHALTESVLSDLIECKSQMGIDPVSIQERYGVSEHSEAIRANITQKRKISRESRR